MKKVSLLCMITISVILLCLGLYITSTTPVFAQPGATAPGIVAPGQIVTVQQDITGNITVNGGTLILDNGATISGMITVTNGGTFNMYNGTITGIGNSSRAVLVTGPGSTFNMRGGVLSNNTGETSGGSTVSVDDFATFNMEGGVIENNFGHGGTIRVMNDSVFNMSGRAIIRNNTIAQSAPGLSPHGGAINAQYRSTINILGGTIYGNHSRDSGAIFIRTTSALYIQNAIIRDNTTNGNGGAINAGTNARITIGNNTTIDNNHAQGDGGGIFSTGNIPINISGNVSISNNRAIGGDGGGIFANGGGSIHFNMTGAMIRNNEAAGNGGGIHATGNFGTTANLVNITDSIIASNTAGGFGGGIWVNHYTRLRIANNVMFTGNTANNQFDHGAEHRGASRSIAAGNSGGANGGNIQHILWSMVSIAGTHAVNNYDINYNGTPFETPPPPEDPDITISKVLRMPYGTAVPYAEFEFEVTLVEVVDLLTAMFPNLSQNGEPISIPTLTTSNNEDPFNPIIEFYPDMTEDLETAALPANTTDVVITGEHTLCFSYIEWPHEGLFIFRVMEVEDSSGLGTDNVMIYSSAIFYIYIYVINIGTAIDEDLIIFQYYTKLRTPTDACDECITSSASCETCDIAKVEEELEFTNIFVRTPDPQDPESMYVRKIVDGRGTTATNNSGSSMGNFNSYFDFDIALSLPLLIPTAQVQPRIYAYITGYARDPNGSLTATRIAIDGPISIIADGITGIYTHTFSHTFRLRHGDVIEFSNVPIGTTYVLTEEYAHLYVQSAIITIGGEPGDVLTVQPEDDGNLVVNGLVGQTVYEGAIVSLNRVLVHNDRFTAPPMGVVTNSVHSITVIVLSIVILVVYTIIRKKHALV